VPISPLSLAASRSSGPSFASVEARERFGPPELIVRRAERDARVERDIERRLAREGQAA